MSISLPNTTAKPSHTTNKRSGTRAVRLGRLLTTDFCPSLNRYVYWLKEPIGWFTLAAAISGLVGATLSPVGWSLAAGIVVLIALGLAFPWLAVRLTSCELEPAADVVHEHEQHYLLLKVRNRLPLPIFGLVIEDFLSLSAAEAGEAVDIDSDEQTVGDVGLSHIPPLAAATYRIPITPQFRGKYPKLMPKLACAFPFAIWTARRDIRSFRGVTVRPLRLHLTSQWERSGSARAESGNGHKAGASGDFLGVRPFRSGDSLRSIHWVQTARTDTLVVCERGAPLQQSVTIELDAGRADGTRITARENLAWRVRIAAALAELLHSRHVKFQVKVDDQMIAGGAKSSITAVLDHLAEIPLGGTHATLAAETASEPSVSVKLVTPPSCPVIRITRYTPAMRAEASTTESSDVDNYFVVATVVMPAGRGRSSGGVRSMVIDTRLDVAAQVDSLLREVDHVSFAA